ncbi:MAG: HAD family hydrolase, partial [Bacteroidota bacterium]
NLLKINEIDKYFKGVVSAKSVQTFKPNPKVYEHFVEQAGSPKENSWLISGNSFDIIGALNCGMKAAWVKRSKKALIDPWGMEPSASISSLIELKQALKHN